ncbi:ABC transporter ATP-binding protein [Lentilactobacillus hilgardii]|uniref:ABC transporter ATP-binding protein n=1 Tax=Lentilactobacillus hilgardii TaxID=1588 RepID=UPI00019C6829|nr:ABC transporter ATP-binding protein [Lentilactobacillus hilgardii]EEI19360.1 ABC transporter, ATP-binding protein [Lentilactobacillus buchneri ATCC 11577]MCT3396060.1 ABC transporter ATP-binding protein [Lentilactobacillus hilgardii]
MMASDFLKVTDLSITLSGNNVINNMTFSIKPNTLTTFLGPSGSGKTTVLRAIAGLNTQISGKIYLDGQEIQQLPVNQRHIGMIFQSYALFPNLSVFENVAYGLRVQKASATDIKNKVTRMLELVSLADKKDAFPDNLSGGQKQRVAIARAMVLEPKLLLLDEPLSALDAKIRVDLRTQIRHYQQELGITMLFVTHDQGEAMAISDDIIVMDDGRVQQQGSPLTIYTKPRNQFIAQFIGNHNLLSGKDLMQLGFKRAQKKLIDPNDQYIVRPELFIKDSSSQSKETMPISGKLTAIAVLGDRIRYEMQTPQQICLKVETLNQGLPLGINTSQTLYLSPDDIEKVGD